MFSYDCIPSWSFQGRAWDQQEDGSTFADPGAHCQPEINQRFFCEYYAIETLTLCIRRYPATSRSPPSRRCFLTPQSHRPRLHFRTYSQRPPAVFRCTSPELLSSPLSQKLPDVCCLQDHWLEIFVPVIVKRLENRTGDLPVHVMYIISADPLRCFLHGR
jgi:hypothetical protein